MLPGAGKQPAVQVAGLHSPSERLAAGSIGVAALEEERSEDIGTSG